MLWQAITALRYAVLKPCKGSLWSDEPVAGPGDQQREKVFLLTFALLQHKGMNQKRRSASATHEIYVPPFSRRHCCSLPPESFRSLQHSHAQSVKGALKFDLLKIKRFGQSGTQL